MFHKFSSRGFLKIFLHEGRMRAEVVSEAGGSPLTSIEHYDTLLNDGKWHMLQFYIMQNQVGLSINGQTSTGSLPAQVRTGGDYLRIVMYRSYLLLFRQLLQHWRRVAWRARVCWVSEKPHGGRRVQEQLWLGHQQPGGYPGWFLCLD